MSSLRILNALPRDVKILIASNVLRSLVSAILTVSFSIYLAKLGAPTFLIGVTYTGRSLFSAIRSLGEGIVADRLGRKPILLFTSLTLIIGGLIYASIDNLTILIVVAVLFSVGGMITYTPADMAMLADKVGDNDRTMAFSLNATLSTVAGILGSLAAALPDILQRFGIPELTAYRQLFLLLAITGTVCFLLFTRLTETFTPREKNTAKQEVSKEERTLLAKWSGVIALDNVGGSFNELISYWYYLRFGVTPAQIGLLQGATRLIATFSYTLGFKMAKRFGMIRATALSRVPIVIINVLTPLLPSFEVVAVGRLLMSVFSDIDVPLRQSYIMGVMRPEARASSYGFVTVVSRFTAAGGPSISGYMYEYVSLSIPFWGAASFQFASLASMYLLFKDIKPPEER